VNGPRALGRGGEDAACAYLERLGYRIVGRNVRCGRGEIDAIARDGETLVFVEVMARRGRSRGSAVSAVDARKRKQLRALAEDFLQFAPAGTKARFDVLAIDGERIAHFRGAFQ
jgi:putative endonuclease